MYSTLIVSARPFFIEETFRALMESTVTVVSPEAYSADLRGYGLYIFDSVSPAELPMDGAVWFINPIGSVENAGFSYQSEVALENGDSLTLSSASSSLAKRLRADVTGSDIYISSYVKCGLYKEFTSLYTYQGNPIIFAPHGDFHNSSLSFQLDFSFGARHQRRAVGKAFIRSAFGVAFLPHVVSRTFAAPEYACSNQSGIE